MPAGSIPHCYGFTLRVKENTVSPFHPFARFTFQGTINLQLPVASKLDFPGLDLPSDFIIT